MSDRNFTRYAVAIFSLSHFIIKANQSTWFKLPMECITMAFNKMHLKELNIWNQQPNWKIPNPRRNWKRYGKSRCTYPRTEKILKSVIRIERIPCSRAPLCSTTYKHRLHNSMISQCGKDFNFAEWSRQPRSEFRHSQWDKL